MADLTRITTFYRKLYASDKQWFIVVAILIIYAVIFSYMVAFSWPRKITYNYAGDTCSNVPTLLPLQHRTKSSGAYRLSYEKIHIPTLLIELPGHTNNYFRTNQAAMWKMATL